MFRKILFGCIIFSLSGVTCSKKVNTVNNFYYCSFEIGSKKYTNAAENNDSLWYNSFYTDNQPAPYLSIDLLTSSDAAQNANDSTNVTAKTVITFGFDLYNYGADTSLKAAVGTYNYTNGNSSLIGKQILYAFVKIRKYNDPNKGKYYISYPDTLLHSDFSVTVTQITSTYISGTFRGTLYRAGSPTTISNGRFTCPRMF